MANMALVETTHSVGKHAQPHGSLARFSTGLVHMRSVSELGVKEDAQPPHNREGSKTRKLTLCIGVRHGKSVIGRDRSKVTVSTTTSVVHEFALVQVWLQASTIRGFHDAVFRPFSSRFPVRFLYIFEPSESIKTCAKPFFTVKPPPRDMFPVR